MSLRLKQYAEICAFCPVPVYPPVRWLEPAHYVYHRADSSYSPRGIKTRYLEYRTLPWIGRSFNGLLTQSALEPALRAWKPDLILAYWLYPTAWAAVRVGRRMRVPVVVGSRGSDLHRIPDALCRRMTSTALRSAAAVTTVTGETRSLALALGADPVRTRVIPNGCAPEIYHPLDRASVRREFGIPTSVTLLLQVGHLLESKGVLDLWDAFATLAPSHPDLRLALVGEGPAGAEVQARAAAAGLADRLIMPGARPAQEIAVWMNAADVVCLASHGEGCPNVVLEALSCGRPLVGTNVGGIPELVNERCGVLAPARDPLALAQAIEQALARTWDSAQIAASFRRSWDDVARETFELCQLALGRAGSQRSGA